jgi:hypothetical protein
MLPTSSNLEAIAANCRQIDDAVVELNRLLATAVPQINTMLAAAHLTQLQVDAPHSGTGCGGMQN